MGVVEGLKRRCCAVGVGGLSHVWEGGRRVPLEVDHQDVGTAHVPGDGQCGCRDGGQKLAIGGP